MDNEEPDLIQVNFNGDASSLSDEQGPSSTTENQTQSSSTQQIPKGKANLGSAVFNITNTIIGGGIVTLPFVVKSVGIVTAFVLFVVLAAMVGYSALLLINTSLFVFKGPKTYQDLASKAFGRVGPLIVEIVADLYLLGAMTGYTIIVGSVLTESLNELFDWSLDYKIVTLFVTLVVFYPLSALKSIHSLRITSFVAIVGILFLIICIVVRAFQFLSSYGFSPQLKLIDPNLENIFQTIPIILFAYVFHPSVFPVWSEMKDKGKFGISTAIYVSIIIGGLVYISVGIFAYLTFYEQTKGNILLNYTDDPLMFIAKLGYTLVVAFSYPIMSYPLRVGIDSLLFKSPVTRKRIFIETFFIVGLTYALAVLVPNVTVIFGFTAATAGGIIAFLLPSLFMILLVDTSTNSYIELQEENNTVVVVETVTTQKTWRFFFTKKKIPAFLILVAGAVFGALGVWQQIKSVS